MRENMADHFRFTKKSGRFTFIVLGLIPAVLLYGSYKLSGQIDMVGKRRNESIWRS